MMQVKENPSESSLACLAPILNKTASRDLEAIAELHRLFSPKSMPEIVKQVQAIQGLLHQFPDMSLVGIAKVVQSHCDSMKNSPTAVVNRIRQRMQGAVEETNAEIAASLSKMSVGDLKKAAKSFDLELSGRKSELVEAFVVWMESGGTIRPKTKAEITAEAVQEYVELAKPLMATVNPDSAARVLAIMKDVAANKVLGKDGLEEFLKQLDIPASGSKAQMSKRAEDFINRLAMTWVQTHS